jgi:hypothetical protein
MAAARNLPPIPDPNPQQITISNTGVLSPATCIIANGQQVTFINNLSYSINITFEADAQGVVVFTSPVAVPGNGGSTMISPLTNDRTVNYNTDGSDTFPYAIQVGAGPLYISVSLSGTTVQVTPSPAIIPAQGTWQLFKASGDANTYKVTWPNVNNPPFPDFTVNNQTQTASVSTPAYVGYHVKLPPSPLLTTGSGGGTIKVGGN